ncbi:MAG: cohesin domain-containing protein [Euryarchaeota archaeon]|nr:cohesin domain-containing protein [Euryarchaeota archaeon]
MFNKINRSSIVNIVLIMLTTIVVFSSVALSQPTADSISVASDTGENGQTVQVPVNITNVANGPLQVIMFDVNYMHSVVDIVAVTNGDLLPLDSITQQPKWTASSGGNHESVTLSTSDQTAALQNGSTGTIAVLWVSVIGTAGQQTDMNLTNIDVSSTGLEHGTIPSINGTFTVAGVADITPPYTSGHDPAPDATGVPIDTSITVHVLDDGDGVNNSTIVMTVGGAVVTPDITGTSADYTLIYDPPADFTYDQLVNVTIDASDLAGNVMHGAYSFTTAAVNVTTTIIAIDDAIASAGGNDDVTPVMINNVVNVGVVRIDIHYDPSVVWVVDVADGDFDFVTSSIDNAAGVVRIGAMQVASSGLNGDVMLAEVTLQAKGCPGDTSALSIDLKELKDATPQCNPIQTGVEDGIFTVSCLCGDVNGDGNVLLDDAMYLMKHCVKEPGFEQINECASDINCDGAIEMADAMYLAKHCVGVQGFEKLHCCAGQQ